ncbi:MAG: hypothetical protein Q8L27_00370 [archaeon]|nr:hypothetical protein [archaeon]
MIIKRHPTNQEKLVSSAVAILRVLSEKSKDYLSRNAIGRCNMDYFNAVNLALENLSEDGFIFQTTEESYKKYKEKCCGEKGVLYRRILPSDIEVAQLTIESALDDVAAQEYAGYITLYPPKDKIEAYLK